MRRSITLRLTGLFLLLVMCSEVFWIRPLTTLITHAKAASPLSLTYHQFADGPYHVQGNQIIGADGTPYIFHGLGRDGLEFSCTGGGFMDSGHLAFMGSGTSGSNGTYWFANTVRLPLAQAAWLNGLAGQCSAAQYQAMVKQTVDAITALKLNVMLDLQWSDANGQAPSAGWEMPDARSVTFWQQVAPIYANYSNVIFELYNEPHPLLSTSTATWQCWLNGCNITNDSGTLPGHSPSYQAVGMQTLVNTVRNTTANNVVLVAGTNWGYELSGITTFPITGTNVVYDTHPYPYSGKNTPALWDASFGNLTSTYPIISAESGEYDCANTFMSVLVPYFDAHSMGWTAWAWYDVGGTNQGCGYPQVISDYQGTPLASMGTYIYQRFLSYAGQTSPSSPATGPVSPIWYFAEGRAGAGFKEFLTLDNPTSDLCTVNIEYLEQPDNGAASTKTVSVTVPVQTRVTEWVDGDLGTSPTGPGISDSAIITVNTTATPNCTGVVAERPMYFNALGTNSGSDVIGMTQLGKNFYFGDMASGNQPGGGSYASFIAILNPPNAQTASVTASYYANGQKVATQQVNVRGGTRGTIFPSQALPAHVVVVLSSTQPVAIERPSYFSNIQANNAGVVSGAADVVGVQNLSNDWLFAEGYTGGQFQENLVIANVDPANATANVTITLEYPDSTTRVVRINVGAFSQVIWNVNANTSEPGQGVSAEITSSGAKIVAEREMFFHYNHNANGRSLQVIGGTDVLGQTGPAASSSYSFAEGYTNVGYDEWLTVQNPTVNPETITISLVNAKGTVYVTSILVKQQTRATVDITGMVIHFLYHPNDSFMGYEVSMVVQSASGPFVAERPMYFNAAGEQGGSDVIGYTGS